MDHDQENESTAQAHSILPQGSGDGAHTTAIEFDIDYSKYAAWDENGSAPPPCEEPTPLYLAMLNERDEGGWDVITVNTPCKKLRLEVDPTYWLPKLFP